MKPIHIKKYLQRNNAKAIASATDLWTFNIDGLFYSASRWDFKEHDEDFGKFLNRIQA